MITDAHTVNISIISNISLAALIIRSLGESVGGGVGADAEVSFCSGEMDCILLSKSMICITFLFFNHSVEECAAVAYVIVHGGAVFFAEGVRSVFFLARIVQEEGDRFV